MKHPIIDVPTRWNSTFDMLERLLEFKSFCSQMCNAHTFLSVPERIWTFMESFVSVMKPVKDATLCLQASSLLVGDFYGVWLKMKIRVTASTDTIGRKLATALQEREDVLFQQEAVVSAIYMDPRFKSVLSCTQVQSARAHLLKTWNKLQLIKAGTTTESIGPLHLPLQVNIAYPYNNHVCTNVFLFNIE